MLSRVKMMAVVTAGLMEVDSAVVILKMTVEMVVVVVMTLVLQWSWW